MGPSLARSKDVFANDTKIPQHRYNTRRSSKDKGLHKEQRRIQELSNSTNHTNRNRSNVTSVKASSETDKATPSENDTDANDSDNGQQDSMIMDHLSNPTSHPRAPFPSPAIKNTLPFYPFPPSQQVSPMSQMSVEGAQGWFEHETTSRQQAGPGGQCILVEAANRAQMAILVDDMGTMGIEHMEQS